MKFYLAHEVYYSMDDIIFEIVDKSGRKVRLTKKQWKHIMRRHAYMEKYIEEIKETLSKADKIIQKSNSKAHYYKNYKYLKATNKFVFVLVKYLNNHGYIITSYVVGEI